MLKKIIAQNLEFIDVPKHLKGTAIELLRREYFEKNDFHEVIYSAIHDKKNNSRSIVYKIKIDEQKAFNGILTYKPFLPLNMEFQVDPFHLFSELDLYHSGNEDIDKSIRLYCSQLENYVFTRKDILGDFENSDEFKENIKKTHLWENDAFHDSIFKKISNESALIYGRIESDIRRNKYPINDYEFLRKYAKNYVFIVIDELRYINLIEKDELFIED